VSDSGESPRGPEQTSLLPLPTEHLCNLTYYWILHLKPSMGRGLARDCKLSKDTMREGWGQDWLLGSRPHLTGFPFLSYPTLLVLGLLGPPLSLAP
jgi:hypothetical protein